MNGEADSLDCAGRGVVVAIGAQGDDSTLREKCRAGRMQAGLCLGHVPRSVLGQSPAVTDAHEQDVAVGDGQPQAPLAPLEVLGEDVVARLQPAHAAEPRDVEEDAAPDEAVLENCNRVRRKRPRG